MTNFDENVLVFLDEEGKTTPAVIAERLKCSPEEAAEACDRLQERRLVDQIFWEMASLGDWDPPHTKESGTTYHLTRKGKIKAADLWTRIKEQPAVDGIDDVVLAVEQHKAAGHAATTLGDVAPILGTDDFKEIKRRLEATKSFIVWDRRPCPTRATTVISSTQLADWVVELSPLGQLRTEHLQKRRQLERQRDEHREHEREIHRLKKDYEGQKRNEERKHKEELQGRDHEHQNKVARRTVVYSITGAVLAAIVGAILTLVGQALFAQSKDTPSPDLLPASQPAEPNRSSPPDRQASDGK